MFKHIDGHYAFLDGKSDIMIDHCHEMGASYLRLVKGRGFIKIWPMRDVAILVASQRNSTDDYICTLLDRHNS